MQTPGRKPVNSNVWNHIAAPRRSQHVKNYAKSLVVDIVARFVGALIGTIISFSVLFMLVCMVIGFRQIYLNY